MKRQAIKAGHKRWQWWKPSFWNRNILVTSRNNNSVRRTSVITVNYAWPSVQLSEHRIYDIIFIKATTGDGSAHWKRHKQRMTLETMTNFPAFPFASNFRKRFCPRDTIAFFFILRHDKRDAQQIHRMILIWHGTRMETRSFVIRRREKGRIIRTHKNISMLINSLFIALLFLLQLASSRKSLSFLFEPFRRTTKVPNHISSRMVSSCVHVINDDNSLHISPRQVNIFTYMCGDREWCQLAALIFLKKKSKTL